MKRTLSPALIAGAFIFTAHTITNRFIVKTPDWAAIPILLAAAVLIIAGCMRKRGKSAPPRDS